MAAHSPWLTHHPYSTLQTPWTGMPPVKKVCWIQWSPTPYEDLLSRTAPGSPQDISLPPSLSFPPTGRGEGRRISTESVTTPSHQIRKLWTADYASKPHNKVAHQLTKPLEHGTQRKCKQLRVKLNRQNIPCQAPDSDLIWLLILFSELSADPSTPPLTYIPTSTTHSHPPAFPSLPRPTLN